MRRFNPFSMRLILALLLISSVLPSIASAQASTDTLAAPWGALP